VPVAVAGEEKSGAYIELGEQNSALNLGKASLYKRRTPRSEDRIDWSALSVLFSGRGRELAHVTKGAPLGAPWLISSPTSLEGQGRLGASLSMENDCTDDSFQDIVGNSPALKRVLKLAMNLGPSGAPVLILGEAGTGKELMARAVHRISPRRKESFVKIHCGAADAGRLESELFGHSKGAETIAGKIGHLELANNGILFVDEIAHIPLDLQAKLL
jgi:transcriptional regulator of aromatic amino acid metabolism